MQAMWKHRRALVQRGAAGRLGRRGLSYLLVFQVLLPLTAPMIDVYAVYGLLFLPPGQVIATWAAFTVAQIGTAAYALHLDGERYGPLWSLPLQLIVHRQLMYLVVIQSTVMALLGGRLRWHRMVRIGAATAHARAASARVAISDGLDQRGGDVPAHLLLRPLPRPGAEPVVSPPRHDVEMQVRDGLLGAGPTGVQHVDTPGLQSELHRPRHPADQRHGPGQ
jgi:hypothetical protein